MKQCPSCKRTYTDETLLYCLEDGSALNAAYDSEATQVMPFPRTPIVTPPPVSPSYPPPSPPFPPPQQGRSHAPVYVLIALLLLVLGGGALALLIFGYSRLQDSSSAANVNQGRATQSPTSQESSSPEYPSPEVHSSNSEPITSPAASPTPQSAQLVGTWRTHVVENNESMQITYTFATDGSSTAVFKAADGRTETHYGSWRYSDATLFETFPDGGSGKGAIRWIDHDNFEITIIDNGVPLYSGLKRRYRRIHDAADD